MEQLEKRETIDLDNPDDVDYLFRFSMTAERIVIQQRAEITQLLAELAAANEAKRELVEAVMLAWNVALNPDLLSEENYSGIKEKIDSAIDIYKEQP